MFAHLSDLHLRTQDNGTSANIFFFDHARFQPLSQQLRPCNLAALKACSHSKMIQSKAKVTLVRKSSCQKTELARVPVGAGFGMVSSNAGHWTLTAVSAYSCVL